MKTIKLIIAVCLLALLSCEKYEEDSLKVSINVSFQTDSINWSNPITTYFIVPVTSNLYCPQGGWEIHLIQGNNEIILPGPCFKDTIVVKEWPQIKIYSEIWKVDTLDGHYCKFRKFFSEIDGQIGFIGADTLCDAKDGETPFIDIKINKVDSLCNEYLFQINDKITSRTICNGSQGPIGPEGPQGPKGDSDTIVKITYTIEYDTIREITSHIDTLWISENIFILESHTDTIVRIDSVLTSHIDTIVCIKNTNNFRETIIKDGPFKLYKCDTLWFTDLFSDSLFSIDQISFRGGNKKGAEIRIIGKNNYGGSYELFDFYWTPIPEFNYLIPGKYLREFTDTINAAWGVSSIGIIAKYSLTLCERNDYVHIINVKISGTKTIVE